MPLGLRLSVEYQPFPSLLPCVRLNLSEKNEAGYQERPCKNSANFSVSRYQIGGFVGNGSKTRHSRESRNPVERVCATYNGSSANLTTAASYARYRSRWIPAFAGMTAWFVLLLMDYGYKS